MKYCAKCNKELPKPINEFGDMRDPVCQKCFLSGEDLSAQEKDELEELKDRLGEIDDEIDELEDEKFSVKQKISAIKHPPPTGELEKLKKWITGSGATA